jgi:FtsH-binding integral membrane protein
MTCFSIATGILFSTLTKVKTTHAIQTAILGSVVIFVSMFVFGLTLYAFGISLDSRIGVILLLILIGLILARFVQIFFYNRSKTYNKYVTWIALVLFSGFIIYDTNRILQPDYNRDFVMASMDYYLDIINLFVNMLGRN